MISIPNDVLNLIFEFASYHDQTWVPIVSDKGEIELKFNRKSKLNNLLTNGCISLWPNKKSLRFATPLIFSHVFDDGIIYNTVNTYMYTTILAVYPRHGFYVYIEFEADGVLFRGTLDVYSDGIIIKPQNNNLYANLNSMLYGKLYDGWVGSFVDDMSMSLLKVIVY